MHDFEEPASFYLGRDQDLASGRPDGEPLLYDARDLTTHAVCVGMTGSGKTGLCVTLLEEAGLDGTPAIVIDPKGDMGNLLLGFPDLEPASFEPWIDPGEAARKGMELPAYAEEVAGLWKKGLASWGQDGERIRRLHDSVDMAIYTPGSNTGLPLTVLRSFDAPPAALRADTEAVGDRVQAAVSGLLALLGIDADPIRSREAILLANILQEAWMAGRDMELADLIREIQTPPFERLGVLDLESFFPAKERFNLAMSLNNLLASPGFAPWLEGESLDVSRLLHTEDGKPRISILSIAHLSEAERMFFVTILLNEIVAWMRTQPGTSSLRALLYMDEIFGYFPPTKEPPSKKPMLTLLKQARAFGVGVVLATQNPVDLDYKGLSNTGTWFIGRLQTERDKLRVLDGLEGAMSGGGKRFDRGEVDRILSGLGKRVFLMNNVHEDAPRIFQTRWALSYLRGPLTRAHIVGLMADRKRTADEASETAPPAPSPPAPAPVEQAPQVERPVLPVGVEELYERPTSELPEGARVLYRPALAIDARLHFSSASERVEEWRAVSTLVPLAEEVSELPWAEAVVVEGASKPRRSKRPLAGATYAAAPAEVGSPQSYRKWQKELKNHLYETHSLTVWKNRRFKIVSRPDAPREEVLAQVEAAARAECDEKIAEQRARYRKKIDQQEERIRKAREKVATQEAQYAEHKRSVLVSIGSALVGLFTKKRSTGGATAARRASRAAKEKDDVRRAERELEAQERELAELSSELEREIAALENGLRTGEHVLEERIVRPRKSDIVIESPAIVWQPLVIEAEGDATASGT